MKAILLNHKSTLVFLFLYLITLTSFGQEEYTKINVLDDVWVSEADPYGNKDGETDMGVVTTTTKRDSRETYLKFDISKLYGKGGLVSAALTMVGAQSNNSEWTAVPNFYIVVYECSNDWSEKTITWANKVAPKSEIVAEESILEPKRYEIIGTSNDPESIKKCIENAMKNHAQFMSFVIKAKQVSNSSRVWFSDKGWEPAALEVIQDYNLDEPGNTGVWPEILTVSSADNVTSITEDNGTLQMISKIEPEDADPRVVWSVLNDDGEATISPTGLLKALKDGVVTVQAETPDRFLWATMDITISGQNYTWNERNYIPNGNFSEPGSWFGNLSVENGVAQLAPIQVYETASEAPVWNFTTIPYAKKDRNFIFSFKMWAEKNRSIHITMFDKKVGTYGISTDAQSLGGQSEWTIENIPTQPTWFTFHVTFPNMPEDCTQDLNFNVGLSEAKVYLDSVSLMTVEDYALKANKKSANSLKVYPNPVNESNELTVRIEAKNEKVAVYNVNGQKLMEKMADGNIARFNVSNLVKGVYVIKLNNGTSAKFVKY